MGMSAWDFFVLGGGGGFDLSVFQYGQRCRLGVSKNVERSKVVRKW